MKTDNACIIRDAGTRLPPLDRQQLRTALAVMNQKLNPNGSLPELRLSGDATVEQYNREFLGGTGPTNILSFPSDDPDLPGLLLLSCPACQREAMLYGQNTEEYCLRLLAHGLAHLAGMDHGPEMERASAQALATALHALECQNA